MIADRKIAKEIESHFYNHANERMTIAIREAEIAEMNPQAITETGVRGTDVSDPTLAKAIRMEEELKEARGWAEVVKSTYEHFKGKPQEEFLAMVYTEKQSVTRVCAQMYFDRSTYFRWREKILDFALVKAVERGVVKM